MTQEALRLALEALNDMACWQDGKEVGMGFDEPYAADTSRKTITAIKEALAQTQEPLTENGMYRLGYHNGYGFGEAYGKASALQRPWVGLTAEEIQAFDTWHDNREEEVGWCNPSEIVAYIDAKLKQKNGYAEEKNT